ncbi:MAG: hypothetical protein IJS52_01955, partial [Bacilli bacterium]|nr:hypothetical protein [Bacilli bacterium]
TSSGGYSYDDIKGLPFQSDYYSREINQYAANPCYLSESPKNQTIIADTGTDGIYNVAAFQFTYNDGNFIEAGNKISCTLQSLTFTYSCK